MRAPVIHDFAIDGEPYQLSEWGYEGALRIQLAHAHDIAQVPGGVLDALYGNLRYNDAVIRECLTKAPAFWWEADPSAAPLNGSPKRRVTFAKASNAHRVAMQREVIAFLEAIFQADQPPPESADAGRVGESVAVADLPTPAPYLAGRAF